MSQPRGRAVPPALGGDRAGKGQPAQAPALPTLGTAGLKAGGREPSGLVGDHVLQGWGRGGSLGGPWARRGRSAAHARLGPGGRWMPAGPRPQGHTRARAASSPPRTRGPGLSLHLGRQGCTKWLTRPFLTGVRAHGRGRAELCLLCRADGLSLPGFRALQRQMEIFVD